MRRQSATRFWRTGVRFRRLRALLAGALVFGVGATVTLAAWNDSEFATGSFSSSVFSIVGAVDGSSFSEHPSSATAAELAFSATDMSPGSLHYAPLDVRTSSGTTVAGSVTLDSTTASGTLAPALQYRAVLVSSSSACDSGAFGGSPVWVAGGASTYLSAGSMPSSPPTTPIAAGGTETLRYCFEVRIAPGTNNSYQGASAQVTWQFAAVSDG